MAEISRLEKHRSYFVELGKRVKALREKAGMSQQALADAVEVERNHIYRIEAGKTNPTLGLIRDIASALGKKPGNVL